MVRLVIKGCEFDPAQVKDVVFGDSFRMELDKAMELADAGVCQFHRLVELHAEAVAEHDILHLRRIELTSLDNQPYHHATPSLCIEPNLRVRSVGPAI